MKKSILLGLGACALALGGVAALVGQRGFAPTNADPVSYSGSFGFEFQSIGGFYWDADNDKVAVKITNSAGTQSGWSELIATTAGTHRYIINYNLNFDPTGGTISAYRYDSAVTEVSDSVYHNHIENIKFGQLCYVYGDYGDGTINSINYYIGCDSNSWADSWDYTLHNAKIENDEFQVYGNIALTGGDQFKLVHSTNGDAKTKTYVNAYDGPTSVKSAFSVTDNISCATAGTYRMYYPASSKIWITSQELAEADEWAEAFNKVTDYCDAGDTDWNALATSFSNLIPGSQTLFNNASANAEGSTLEKAAYRYDNAVLYHGKTPFAGGSRASAGANVISHFETKDTNSSIIAALAIGGSFVLGVGVLMLARKAKEEK